MPKKIPENSPITSQRIERPMDPAISRELETSKMNVNDVVQGRHLMQPYPDSRESLKKHEVSHIEPKNKLARRTSSLMSERSQELGFHTVIGQKKKTH